MASKNFTLLLYLGFFMHFIHAVPERGIKEMLFDEKDQYKSFAKSLFKDAEITISGEVTWGKDDDGKPITADTLVLNWYLLYSNCAQYFVQVKEDILPLMVVDKQNMQVQHTIYNQGYLEFKDGHLSKTPIPLEKDKTTPDQLSTSQEQQQPPSKPDDENAGRKRRWIIREKREAPKKGVQPQLNFHPTIQAVLSSKAAKTTKPTTPKAESSKKPALLNKKHTSVKPKISTAAVKGTSKVAGMDGNYLLVISLQQKLPKDASVHVTVRIKMNTGFLSAAEWPLLPFYGAMSLVYLAYGVVWLIVSACQWRELLRIQFWIGGVIALGMLEKAVLFSEYNNVNDTGVPAHGLVVLALVLSCIKRTLSRILIIIVSMGFGIVKPRLGAALHRVLGVGCLYFILCVIEGSYREFSVKADVNRKQVIATVPLSVLDAVICWWIFMSLLQTMRTLRIRKNLVKLSLYRHFTNILIVSVIASVAFMIWVIKAHSFNSCITDWKEIWIDDAFWHFLFALILLAIMVLWRPTANNQRYAFAPLIDVGEDDDDDMTLSDAFQGMKMRGKGESEVPNRAEKQRKKAEDDLKWVEENIPTSGGIDTALPSLLDSDEEMMTTKLEMSKME